MSTNVQLRSQSSQAWLNSCLENFENFLVDHAGCERKAAATCMSFVVKFRDKPILIDAMIKIARDELEHFHEVCRILAQHKLDLGPDEKNPYVNGLLQLSTNGAENLLLDRLLLSGIIELRASERFEMIGHGLEQHPKFNTLSDYYLQLGRDEIKHCQTYFHLAKQYYPEDKVQKRLEELLNQEAKIIEKLPIRPCLH